MAVTVIELLEEVDVDEDRHKTVAEPLPVTPVIPQLLVDRPPVLQTCKRIGSRQTQQRLAAFGRFLVLDFGFEGIQEDVVTLLIQLPVHIGGKREARNVKCPECDLVGPSRRKQIQSDEESGEDDARRYNRKDKLESKKQIGAHHEDGAKNHEVREILGVSRCNRRNQPAYVARDQGDRAGEIKPFRFEIHAKLCFEDDERDCADCKARGDRVSRDIRDQQYVGDGKLR